MDLAPLAPRPEYLPRPDPMPCPMRCFFCFCPLGGRRLLKFICLTAFTNQLCYVARNEARNPLILDDFEQVGNLRHHAAETRGIGTHNSPVERMETQALDDVLVLL